MCQSFVTENTGKTLLKFVGESDFETGHIVPSLYWRFAYLEILLFGDSEIIYSFRDPCVRVILGANHEAESVPIIDQLSWALYFAKLSLKL